MSLEIGLGEKDNTFDEITMGRRVSEVPYRPRSSPDRLTNEVCIFVARVWSHSPQVYELAAATLYRDGFLISILLIICS